MKNPAPAKILAVFLTVAFGVFPARADPVERRTRLQRLNIRVPEPLDLSRERTGRLFAVVYAPQTPDARIPLAQMHEWKLAVRALAPGTRIAEVTIRGDMPQHGHGLPTWPSVKKLSTGDYVVAGIKFNMPGWWVVRVDVTVAGGGTENFAFNLLPGES